MARFHKLQSAQLADEAAERVRRDHALAIQELQRRVEAVEKAPQCVGFAHFVLSAQQSAPAQDAIILFDTEIANTIPSLIGHSSSGTLHLTPGYIYRLWATCGHDGADDMTTLQWYDYNAAAYIGTQGIIKDPNYAETTSPTSIAAAVIDSVRTTPVALRVKAVVSTPDFQADQCWATVEAFRAS